MKRNKQLRKNNKGISTLFIAIYVSLLVVTLLSTLFYALTVSQASLETYLQNDKDRSQERILAKKLNLTQTGDEFDYILINNTGGITVRIKSIYVDGNFLCDPSKLPGDSYIAPQSIKWIDLSSLHIEINSATYYGNWTITTERGTKSSETGANLLSNKNFYDDPNKLYFGPLLLIFNDFKWSNNNGASWHDGWTIPQDPGNVIWRIHVIDIDERPIVLSSSSSFGMIQNSKNPNKIATWGIGPANMNPPGLIMYPSADNYLHFSLNGPNKLDYMFTPIPISSNFLTIIGNFIESDGSLQGFAQTIPFEAIRVVDASQIKTYTTLNPISSPRTVGQSTTVSGQVTVDPGNAAVPSNGIVMIQYSPIDAEQWSNIPTPVIRTNSGGSFSESFSPPHAGEYEYRAVYMGDTQGQTAWLVSASASQIITVNQAPTTTTMQAMASINLGQSTTARATISSSAATGTVTFEISTDNGATYATFSTNTVVSGQATSNSYTPLAPGSNYRFRATYNGNADYLSSQSITPATLTVNKAIPTLTTPTLRPANTITIGSSVTAEVTITGVAGIPGIEAPTGTITFRYSTNGGTSWLVLSTNDIVSGSATSSPYTPQTVGNLFRIRADYNGDANYNTASSASAALGVKAYPNDYTPTVNPSNTVYFGTPVTVTATLTSIYGTPTGSIEFFVSTNNGATFTKLGLTKTLSGGTATSDQYTPPSIGGNYQFKANYLGDTNFYAKESTTITLTVDRAPSTVTLNPLSPISIGQSATVTAIVTPSLATGSVAFEVSTDNGATFNPFCTIPVSGGIAVSQQYTPQWLTSATINYLFRATYNGDTNVFPSPTSSSVTLIVNKANPTLNIPILNPSNQITIGQSVTATVTVSGVSGVPLPTGTVTFRYSTNGGASWNDLSTNDVSSGSVTSSTYTPNTVGTQFRIRADYNGDANYNAASSSVATLSVRGYINDFIPTLTPASPVNFGTPVTATVTLTVPVSYPTPTGNVEFYYSTNNGITFSKLGVTKPLVGGSAVSDQYLPPAVSSNYQFKVNYLGDVNYFAKESTSVVLTVNKATSNTVIDALAPITLGQSTIVTARVNPSVATGTITFEISTDDGATYNLHSTSPITGGTAASAQYTPTLASSATTNYKFRATYNGDSNVEASSPSAPVALIVNKATPTLSIPTINPQSPITLWQSITATVTINGANGVTAPTGTITFWYSTNGGTTWATLSTNSIISGLAASGSYTPDAVGTQFRIRADYNGDANYNTASSGLATLGIRGNINDFNPTLNPAGSVYFGTPVTATVTLAVPISYPIPTGSVEFYLSTDSGATFAKLGATKPLAGGSATSDQYLPSAAGANYQFKANYIGDANYFAKESSTVILTVNKAPSSTSISFTPTTGIVNQATTVRATITPSAATGTVNFEVSTDNGNNYAPLGTSTIVAGVAAVQYTPTTAGSHYWFRASYAGNSNVQTSISPVAQLTVYGPLAFTSKITPTVFHAGVVNQQFTITITNLASGTTKLGSSTIAIPAGFTISSATLSAPSGHNWDLPTVTASLISITSKSGNNNPIDPGDSLVITITASATPTTGTTFTWTTTAYTDRNNGGTRFNTPSLQPTTRAQYLVTFATTGLSTDASGTIVSVGGSTKTILDLPYTTWIDASTGTLTYSYSSSLTSSINGKQYIKTSTDSSPISGITGPVTVNGIYKTQWQVTFAQSGLASDASGTVVTVNGAPKSLTNLPFTSWIDATTGSLPYAYENSVSSSANGKRYSKTSTDNSPITGLTNPITITGAFETQYFLTVTSEHGIATGQGWYSTSATATFSVNPTVVTEGSTQYVFTAWSGDSSSTTSVANIVMNGPKTVIANWQTKYAITATAAPNGAITPSGTVFVNFGSSQTFTITPNTGYHIADVLVDGNSVGAVTSYTINSIQAAQTISATFAVDTYTITPSSGPGGLINPSTLQNADYGTTPTFTITPTLGYHIVDVAVDGVSIGTPSSYTFSPINANHIITASFAINAYTITVTAGPNGQITPTTTTVNHGDSLTFDITPNPGYHTVDVLVDGSSIGPSTTYTFSNVVMPHTISATFAIDQFTITVTAGAGGTISPTTTMVPLGSDQTFTITPDSGYHIVDVLIDGASQGPISSYTFISVQTNHLISANFETNP